LSNEELVSIDYIAVFIIRRQKQIRLKHKNLRLPSIFQTVTFLQFGTLIFKAKIEKILVSRLKFREREQTSRHGKASIKERK
jgi:hypothetical protein